MQLDQLLSPNNSPEPLPPPSQPLDVEISVVDHGRRDLTAKCLRSLPAAAGDLRWHATVVRNLPGIDNSDTLRAEFPWVEVRSNSAPLGFGANHNQVISSTLARSRARFVLVLNNDTELPPGSVEQLVGFADARPQLGAVGPILLDGDGGSSQPSYQPFPGIAGQLRRTVQPGKVVQRATQERGWLSGACLLLRVDALRQVGLFDTRFFMFFEDVDLAVRLAAAGWASAPCPEVAVVHHNHGTVGQPHLAMAMECQMLRSTYLYLRKHHGRAPASTLAALARAALALRAAKALAESLLHLPDMGRARPQTSLLVHLALYDPRRPLPHEGLSCTMTSPPSEQAPPRRWPARPSQGSQ